MKKMTTTAMVAGMTVVLLSACVAPAVIPEATPAMLSPPSAPAAVTGPPADALTALIQAERQASIDRDLAMLELLWSPDSRIIDGRNTATSDDDYVWAGRDAILDRYVVAVFPNPPPPLADSDALRGVSVRVESDNLATGINGGDRWRLVRVDGRWWLQELAYQQP